jgi:hypothetical protein
MSKLLIHMGPPKTGSTQLQNFFNNNSEALKEKSIDYIRCKPKQQIRGYFRAIKEIEKKRFRFLNSLKPWYLDCPESYFFKESSNNDAIISEEAFFKMVAYKKEILSFDNFLSKYYSERLYLVVLREINGHVTSGISQSIKGVWRFDYKNCVMKLKRYSLDRDFLGMIGTKLNLEVESFNNFVVDPEASVNISSVLEDFFVTSNLELQSGEEKNASLGAEGTAIHMAYNNILRLLMGEHKLRKLRQSIIPFARQFRGDILESFPVQEKFCPYAEEYQSKFLRHHLENSKKFIKRYPGVWVDDVFTPVIRKKNIAFISEVDMSDAKAIHYLLECNIKKTLKGLGFEGGVYASSRICEAIDYFVKNERGLVLEG